MPPAAVTCTMPRPIAPVPITPTVKSGRLMSNFMKSPYVTLNDNTDVPKTPFAASINIVYKQILINISWMGMRNEL
jgi:hypothetical protein